jgi:hypothetical protein
MQVKVIVGPHNQQDQRCYEKFYFLTSDVLVIALIHSRVLPSRISRRYLPQPALHTAYSPFDTSGY